MELNGIPGNFFDAETGEALRPVYKWRDAMGYRQEKELAMCTWSELFNFGVGLWNVQMSDLVQSENVLANKITILDMLKIFSYLFTSSTLLISTIILIAMFIQ